MYGTYCRLNVHIGDSWRDVVRAVHKKLVRSVRYDPKYRERRKQIYRAMLAEHAKARKLAKDFALL